MNELIGPSLLLSMGNHENPVNSGNDDLELLALTFLRLGDFGDFDLKEGDINYKEL